MSRYTNDEQKVIRENPIGSRVRLLTVGGMPTDVFTTIARYTIYNGVLSWYGYDHGDNPPFTASQIGEKI